MPECLVKVGHKYKVKAPGVRDSGHYEVREIRPNKRGQWEVIAKHEHDPHTRIFLDTQFLQEQPKKGKKVIVSEEGELVHSYNDGVELVIEEVSYWPNWGRRGRPAKQAA